MAKSKGSKRKNNTQKNKATKPKPTQDSQQSSPGQSPATNIESNDFVKPTEESQSTKVKLTEDKAKIKEESKDTQNIQNGAVDLNASVSTEPVVQIKNEKVVDSISNSDNHLGKSVTQMENDKAPLKAETASGQSKLNQIQDASLIESKSENKNLENKEDHDDLERSDSALKDSSKSVNSETLTSQIQPESNINVTNGENKKNSNDFGNTIQAGNNKNTVIDINSKTDTKKNHEKLKYIEDDALKTENASEENKQSVPNLTEVKDSGNSYEATKGKENATNTIDDFKGKSSTVPRKLTASQEYSMVESNANNHISNKNFGTKPEDFAREIPTTKNAAKNQPINKYNSDFSNEDMQFKTQDNNSHSKDLSVDNDSKKYVESNSSVSQYNSVGPTTTDSQFGAASESIKPSPHYAVPYVVEDFSSSTPETEKEDSGYFSWFFKLVLFPLIFSFSKITVIKNMMSIDASPSKSKRGSNGDSMV